VKKNKKESRTQRQRRQSAALALWIAGIVAILAVGFGLTIWQASQPKPIRASRGIEARQDSNGNTVYAVYMHPFHEEQAQEADSVARRLLQERLKKVAPGARVSEEPPRQTSLETPVFGKEVRLEYKVLPPPSEQTRHEAKL
jgi:hypothetical protein